MRTSFARCIIIALIVSSLGSVSTPLYGDGGSDLSKAARKPQGLSKKIRKAFNQSSNPAPAQSSITSEPLRSSNSTVRVPSSETASNSLSLEKLATEIATRRARVPEFRFIREEAERRGLRVWLFGGTAAGYAHYVKWDLLREQGDHRFQANRFDYDYTNIYRSTQDLDIVVDGNARDAEAFEQALKTQFPYFLGSKAAGWEVRSIKEARGDKGGLLGDFGFMNQHTDSNSTGMVELTDPTQGESFVRDIRDWDNHQDSAFLKDVAQGRLTFYHSPKHEETPRYKSGQNPAIFSVIRALTKAFQYELKINGEDLAIIQNEIHQFNPRRDLSSPDAARWIEKNGKKLFQHAVDLEYAWNTLEKLGLRKKLIGIQNNPRTQDSLSWWMNKEPLRGKSVGEGSGQTAESLDLKTVAHETRDFLAYESMTRSHTGIPNVFISRTNAPGETASYGEGFYTAVGKKGAQGTGITIRFEVEPNAREGTDFTLGYGFSGGKVGEGAYVVWKNRNAIRVIPESLDMSPVGYFEFLAEGKSIGQDDQALLWKLKRRLDHSITSGLIPDKDMQEIRGIVLAQIKSNASNKDGVVQEWLKIEGTRLKKDPKEVEALADSLKTKSYQADPCLFFEGLSELSRGTDLEPYVIHEWLPSIAKTLRTDIGDRALEQCVLSKEPFAREFGKRALADRESNRFTPFVRALKAIEAEHGEAKVWFHTETKTWEQILEKAAYLALHPELRQTLTKPEMQRIGPAFETISNLPVYEKLLGGPLPENGKSESFQFIPYRFPASGVHFKMGDSPDNSNKLPYVDPVDVTLTQSFEMQMTSVTQLQWSIVMGDNPSRYKTGGLRVNIHGKSVEMNPNRPVENVSWNEAQKFIQKLNVVDSGHHYRLPTEAEREYATRAGTVTDYSFGNDLGELGAYGWYYENSKYQTHDVATLKPNPDGLYDMHGNVKNWVQDWRDSSYHHGKLKDPTGPIRGRSRVIRGCDWYSRAWQCRSARRDSGDPDSLNSDTGFRLVRSPKR